MVSLLLPSIILIAIFSISSSFAAPVQQHSYQITISNSPSIIKVPGALYFEEYNRVDSLSSYYSAIAEKVLDTTINEILEAAPESYSIIHELQLIGKEYCRTQMNDLLQVLERDLNHVVRNSVLSSVRPIVDGIIDKNTDTAKLNTFMSQQLGSVISTKEVATSITRQMYQEDKDSALVQFWKLHTNRIWAETMHHEQNEATALAAWLHSWLIDFEYIFKEEFDNQISNLS